MKVKKGDQVEVISGKDKGKRGEVLSVDRKKDRVVVEGVNIVHRHMRPTQDNPQGGIIENEAPIHVSNVMVVCPRCDEKSRIGYRRIDNDEKVRYCKKCEEVVDV
ncbi:MAG: 50S ribosomal protein L24 [Bacillota bacterium]